MRVFVTGVAGFLGSYIAEAMMDAGHHVIGVDNMIGGDKDNIPYGVEFYRADCTDFNAMREFSSKCDLVYHCAALAYEGLSVFSPALVASNIVGGAVGVFSAAIANKVRRIVHCSSMARYGGIVTPFREYDSCRPVDPYGIAKRSAEELLINMCTTHKVEYVIAVPHNIIGPRQKYDDPFRNVASIMINLMLQDRQPVIYGTGKQRRCFSFIGDCVDCLVKMGTLPGVRNTIINIGPDGVGMTILELAEVIAALLGWSVYKLAPKHMPGRPQEVPMALCSSDKAREYLGFKEGMAPAAGLAMMVNHIKLRGTKQFKYHLPIEIETDQLPATWRDRLF